jgi:hypothetical protein
MSAFICNDYHISVLANYAWENGLPYYWNGQYRKCDNPERIGAILKKENVRSVNYRYSERQSTKFEYDASVVGKEISRAQILQAAFCLNYQSCERDDWPKSEAHAIIMAIVYDAAYGFSDGEWEIQKPEA